jgi:hypothetical protein
VYGNDANRLIPVYRLDEDAHDATDFRGGSGESAALRVAIPEAFWFYTHDDWEDWTQQTEIVVAFWTMTEAFIFGEGYQKLGWTPAIAIEHWLAEHILAFLLRSYAADYRQYVGPIALAQDGLICRLPTAVEQAIGGKAGEGKSYA